MAELSITITPFTDTDFDNIAITEKILTSTIDEINTGVSHSEDNTVTDADAKTAYKTKLTNLGFAWDTEI